jgi:uncharacterized protein
MTRDQIIAALRTKAQDLRAEGVIHLSLFGSRARGDASDVSDLDVLIDTNPRQRFSLINLSGVGLAIEDAVGIPSQIVLRRSLEPAFADRIRDDIVDVF